MSLTGVMAKSYISLTRFVRYECASCNISLAFSLHLLETVQILDAVMYVHNKGMMHRDLKPSNIFFSLEGNIKVGDFGLVTSSAYGGLHNSYLTLKGLGDEQHRQHTGNLGTHFYMSPEQVSERKYDHKVDIYSLGVIFFELHYPFSTDMERAKVIVSIFIW